MPELTDPDNDGILEFTQTAEDADGDSLSITLELDQINGTTQSGSDRNPSWLSYSTSEVIQGGTTTVEINVELNASELGDAGTTYTFLLEADDGTATTDRTFTLDVEVEVLSGESMYIIDNLDDKIREYDLPTAWDISTASVNGSVATKDGNAKSLYLRSDGKKLYILGNNDQKIRQYDLSTAWDISTASTNETDPTSTPTEGYDPQGVFFRDDGKKMYTVAASEGMMYEFDLSVAWDVSTASLNQGRSTQNTSPTGLHFRSDGKKLYTVDRYAAEFYEYNLSTAWDISTAYLKQSKSTQDTSPAGLFFRGDGKKLYTLGSEVYEYDLSTAWDISTASLKQTTATGASGTAGIVFGR